MVDVMQWLEERAPGFAQLSDGERGAIVEFAFLRSLFESRVSDTAGSAARICAAANTWREHEELDAAICNEEVAQAVKAAEIRHARREAVEEARGATGQGRDQASRPAPKRKSNLQPEPTTPAARIRRTRLPAVSRSATPYIKWADWHEGAAGTVGETTIEEWHREAAETLRAADWLPWLKDQLRGRQLVERL